MARSAHRVKNRFLNGPIVAPVAVSSLDLPEVARSQRLLLLSIVFTILGNMGFQVLADKHPALSNFVVPVYILFASFAGYSAYRGGKAMQIRLVWLWVIGMLVPILSAFLLALLNFRAIVCLKKGGYEVGLLGAKLP